ncbi:ATPase [Sphingomonas antarctica]|uniref:ATP12 family chaperone protein n=1 Tax=Sphingomonas antarctica TaxID=2040274 RepID=UPI0039E7DEE6
MKRFWRDVTVEGGAIRLDARPVRTPARAELTLPNATLAEAVAEEWRAVEGEVKPAAMPLTGLSNAAIDRADDTLAESVAAYAESDLLSYRADDPDLAAEEAAVWDPLLAWARGRYDVAFHVTVGIIHVAQPIATVERLGAAVHAVDPFQLVGLQQLATIGGSLITALAVFEGAITAEAAFDATHVDELWQAGKWGEDYLATAAREARRRDFLSAASFLRLLQA